MKSPIRPLELLMLAVLSSVIQLVLATYFAPGLYLDLTLIIVLYGAWHSSPQRGLLIAAAFGLLQDLAMLAPLVGLNSLSKTLVVFLAIQLSRWIDLEGSFGRLLVTAGLSVLDHLILLAVLTLLGLNQSPPHGLDLLLRASLTGFGGLVLMAAYDRAKSVPRDYRQL